MYEFSFGFMLKYWDVLLEGLFTTVKFTGICILFGVLLGFFVSLMRTSNNKVLKLISNAYVEFFRGTPVLIQLFWVFFCLPLILGVDISNFSCSVIALTLYMGAICSETFRSSLKSISREQHDACVSLGLEPSIKILYVIFPQAILRSIPTLLSNCVSLFKESALVSTVGMADLMYTGQNIASSTARPVEALTTVAIIYFAIAFPITRIVSRVEGRLLVKVSS